MENYHNLKLLCGSNMLRGGKLEVFLLYALIQLRQHNNQQYCVLYWILKRCFFQDSSTVKYRFGFGSSQRSRDKHSHLQTICVSPYPPCL